MSARLAAATTWLAVAMAQLLVVLPPEEAQAAQARSLPAQGAAQASEAAA